MQKPLQDIYTCALFMSFVMLTVFGGIQAVSVLEQSGLVLAGASPVSIALDDMDTLDEGMLAAEGVSVKECEVVYHRASQGNVYLDGYPYLVADREMLTGSKPCLPQLNKTRTIWEICITHFIPAVVKPSLLRVIFDPHAC